MQNYYRSLNHYNDRRALMVAKMYDYPQEKNSNPDLKKEDDNAIIFYPKKDTVCNKKGNNFYYRGVT